ncbi:High affinity choline transporter 1 [Branchiostoma belcheri]|nr:High affinity choline transporter 1 [Branchiostoma belcheri]
MPKPTKEKTSSAHLAKDPAKSAKNSTKQRHGLHREDLEQRDEQKGTVHPRHIEETQAFCAQADNKAKVPKRKHRHRGSKPYKSQWLSSDESEDSSDQEQSQRQSRHRHKKHHSHHKTSSARDKTSSTSSSAHRPKKDKKRSSPPHVVLKLRRVASSPHPTAKGVASTGRHDKEYVVIHGNKSKPHPVGHGDTGRLKSSTLDLEKSSLEVRKDGRRRISYEEYKTNVNRSASHKSKVVAARATYVPSATAHTSQVSAETERSDTNDRRTLKARPLGQSEEQRLAEVTARIRARTGAICPLTAEWSLKKKPLSQTRPTPFQPQAVPPTETRRTALPSSRSAATEGAGSTLTDPASARVQGKATTPKSRTGMTLAEFVKMTKQKGGKDRLSWWVRPGQDGIWSGREEGFWHQPQYRIESALFPGNQQVPRTVQSCHPAATAVTAPSHDVPRTESQSEPLTSRPTPLEVLQRVRAKHKVGPKDSKGGDVAKRPNSRPSCDPKPVVRRHGNANGIKRADIRGKQVTSRPKPVTSQSKPLMSPPTPGTSPHKSLTSQITSPQKVSASDNKTAQLRVPDADSPAAEPAKPRQHSVWSSDSESESDGECWCMESVVTATAEAQGSAKIAGITSVSSEIPTPEDRHAGAMVTMESAVPETASVITEVPVSTTTETASAEVLGHVSTAAGTAMPASGKAALSYSTATTTLPQPISPLTQEDHITLEEALATLVASEREGNPKTAGKVSTERKTPAQESSEVKKNTEGTSSSGSQEEWFRVFLDEAFGDFRPVSPTGSLHSSLFGSSKSELSQEETGSTGNGKVRSSTESTLSSASSAQSSKDTGGSNGKMTVAKKRAQSSSDTSSSKGGRGSASNTTSSGSLSSSEKSRRPGKRIGSKKQARRSSDTSSSQTDRGYSTSSTTTPSSVLSGRNESTRGGQKTGSKKRARSSSSDTSRSKRGRTSTSTSTSTSTNSLTRNGKKSRRAGKRTAPKKRARSSSNKSGRGRASVSTSCLPPSKKRRTQDSPDIKPYKITRTKPPDQNKLISMYYSCEPIDFFAPEEKRDDGEDGYETPWNFGVTPNLSLSRSDDGLWHSCKPVRSLSRPPPLPPPLYRPRPPWLEDVEDSPPPTSPGSPRHPDYPLRFGATGRSQPTRFYTTPYRRVGVLEHVGSPLQSTSTCPDHMVARYQNYLWIEPYDWSGTDMCDMFDATELR